MNQQQTEKIKLLVQTSAILSPSEKAEWLALLELMNDRQLMELEKILQSGSRNQALSQPVRPPVSAGLKPVSPAAQTPKLSHILNLPKIGQSDNRTIGQSQAAKPNLQLQKDLVNRLQAMQEPQSGFGPSISVGTFRPSAAVGTFGQKLKAMFAEKELSAPPLRSGPSARKPELSPGKPAAPLELPEPPPEESALHAFNLPVPKPKPKPQFFPPAGPKSALVNIGPAPVKAKTPESRSGFAPGINFPKASEQAKRENLAAIREHILERPKAEKPAEPAKPAPAKEGLASLTLADLALLDIKVMRENDYNSLFKKIKDFTGLYGYHETLFNLEKSPLYQAYIKSGSQALAQASGFEHLGPGCLTRQQFEKFVDLLRQIQVG